MLHHIKPWLASFPWPAVVQLNRDHCQTKGLTHTLVPDRADQARGLWEGCAARPLPLSEAVDLCRRCHDLTPFTFGSASTFVAIAHALIEELAQRLPPVEAQVLRNTVGHYVAGLISRKELERVFRHFNPRWGAGRAAPSTAAVVAAAQQLVS
ncbi:MAG: hypothetical protein HXY24_14075 [Rubrivivax sp.]|nr:hypothetical protein [Rubrivivax sp.]